jgi:hypothetical protein
MLVNVNLPVSNNQPESRMREIRQSGSVGGEPSQNGFPTSIGVRAINVSERRC